jgi:hypothetical protein
MPELPRLTYERPRLTVSCIGTKDKRHSAIHIRTYARHQDGTWMQQHSGTRTNANGDVVHYLVPDSGVRTATGNIEMSCPNPKCPYIFRQPTSKVLLLFDKAIEADEHEVYLLALDIALQRGL